jgi:hypothetical protein
MSTPPALSKFAGNCAAYTPNCIGATQIVVFYISLPILAIGVSGHEIFLSSFAEELLPIQAKSDQDHPKRKRPGKLRRRRKKPGKEMVIWVSSQSSFLEQQMPIQTESDQDDLESKKPGKLRRFFQKLITESSPVSLLIIVTILVSFTVAMVVPIWNPSNTDGSGPSINSFVRECLRLIQIL